VLDQVRARFLYRSDSPTIRHRTLKVQWFSVHFGALDNKNGERDLPGAVNVCSFDQVGFFDACGFVWLNDFVPLEDP